MKQILIFSFVLICWISLSFVKIGGGSNGKFHHYIAGSNSTSTNPPVARTGAPGEVNCTGCHVGGVMSAGGVVDLDFSGVDGVYYPDSTYEFTVSIPSGIKNGFEMTLLDENDDMAGTFTAGPNTSSPTYNGRNYIRHSASVGMHEWTFNWTAPSENVGNVRAYFCAVRSDSSISTSGDEVFLGQDIIEPAADASVSKLKKIDLDYFVRYEELTDFIHVQFRVPEYDRVVLNVQDLNGRLIQYNDFGMLSSGLHKEEIVADKVQDGGIYFVSLFIGNNVFNRKIWLK